MKVAVDDELVVDDILAGEDIEDDHIDAEDLDDKTHLLDHDVIHMGDVLY